MGHPVTAVRAVGNHTSDTTRQTRSGFGRGKMCACHSRVAMRGEEK